VLRWEGRDRCGWRLLQCRIEAQEAQYVWASATRLHGPDCSSGELVPPTVSPIWVNKRAPAHAHAKTLQPTATDASRPPACGTHVLARYLAALLGRRVSARARYPRVRCHHRKQGTAHVPRRRCPVNSRLQQEVPSGGEAMQLRWLATVSPAQVCASCVMTMIIVVRIRACDHDQPAEPQGAAEAQVS
jgi:hypothetical protein